MTPLPDFPPYAQAGKPLGKRWLSAGGVYLSLVAIGAVLLPEENINAGLFFAVVLIGAMAGLLCFVLRLLYYQLACHNAQTYQRHANQLIQQWWEQHRQWAALSEAVLIGAAGTTSSHWRRLLKHAHAMPTARIESAGKAIRLLRSFSLTREERECQLARTAAIQWHEQYGADPGADLLCCYWLGSEQSWISFSEQLQKLSPKIVLPGQPEKWNGVSGLNEAISRLNSAGDDAAILYAGSQSMPASASLTLPAGEAAFVWLLKKNGKVKLYRGEYHQPELKEDIATAASRAIKQARSDHIPEDCFLFSQADMTVLEKTGWPLNQYIQDGNWGYTGEIEQVIVQTLAALRCEITEQPVGWIAGDPQYPLALGIVKPYGTRK
ncbi:hypothetical protein V2I52_17045 [Brenneria sp. g21c3]|uniref:hypothetical protein n=1 Tax=Brenneria sp. g21c3 TaxID=3093893 RepID=UPI002EA24BC7|nr:hypothetical protein [Brenneria sp. g21c3]